MEEDKTINKLFTEFFKEDKNGKVRIYNIIERLYNEKRKKMEKFLSDNELNMEIIKQNNALKSIRSMI